MYAALGGLRVVAVLEMEGRHTVQPGLPQLWGVAVRLSQGVVQVHQLLVVILVDLEARETTYKLLLSLLMISPASKLLENITFKSF